MPRWDPRAEDRLRDAALELFLEHGYDNVTVAQITERAGLTRRTFSRYFTDKRDVLFAGSEQLPARPRRRGPARRRCSPALRGPPGSPRGYRRTAGRPGPAPCATACGHQGQPRTAGTGADQIRRRHRRPGRRAPAARRSRISGEAACPSAWLLPDRVRALDRPAGTRRLVSLRPRGRCRTRLQPGSSQNSRTGGIHLTGGFQVRSSPQAAGRPPAPGWAGARGQVAEPCGPAGGACRGAHPRRPPQARNPPATCTPQFPAVPKIAEDPAYLEDPVPGSSPDPPRRPYSPR